MRRWILVPLLTVAGMSPAAAQRGQVSPYVEVGQVVLADLNSGDAVTYTQLTAGVDATVQTRRVQVQASYQYQRFIEWDDDVGDGEIHSGLLRGTANVNRWLSLEAGAVATRARSDVRGLGFGPFGGARDDNSSQLWGVYGGPTIATQAGPFSIGAAYQVGYVKAEVPGAFDLVPGQQRLDYYDDATSHLATASIGTRAGTVAPFGFTVSGAFAREDANQLDQRFEGKFVRGDIVQPITPALAAVGGVGYEKIEVTQRDPLIDALGRPVVDGAGRFVTDPASPPRLAYETDGLIWDAGVLWRPSPRTMVEARVGERYGTMTYIGSLSWATGPGAGLQVGVYDSVTSFGRQLVAGIGQLPTSFFDGPDPFGSRFGGCTFGGGTTPEGAPAPGACLQPIFQSISTANFRARGVDAIYSWQRGATRLGFGGGYANRRYYLPPVPGAIIYRTNDEAWYAQGFAQTALDANSGLTGDLYANYFTSGVAGAPDVWGGGAQGSYYRNFGRAYGSLSGGVYTFDAEGLQADWTAQALLAVGVRF